jgi:small subunit ribosomal protein S4
MMTLLENRLDNVVYRAGLASSRNIARQLVNHGHFTVDNQKCDIASKQVKLNEVIAVKKNKLKNKYWENLKKEIDKKDICSWLEVNKGDLSIKVKENPNIDQVKQAIAMNLIIEFYSR